MAKTSRWGGLRIEPYDANAIDADGDGIVQEGTAFERPVGTRILDELGRELVGGHTSNAFMPGIQYVDQGGKPVDFLPSGRIPAPEGPKDRAKATGLSRIGHSTLKERGSLSILDIQKAAFARTAAPSPPAAPVVNQKDLATATARLIEEKAIERRRRLRIEPYDPDAKDGDGDGIVQDGTAWERPAGTRIITSLGREVAKGMTTTRPSPLNRIVDSDGNEVDYTPKWRRVTDEFDLADEVMAAPEVPAPKKGPSSPLGQLGHPTLSERGHATLDDYVSPQPLPEPEAPADAPQAPALNEPELPDTPIDELSDTARAIEKVRSEDQQRPNAPAFLPDLPDVRQWPPDLPYEPGDIPPNENVEVAANRDLEYIVGTIFDGLAEFLLRNIDALDGMAEDDAIEAFLEAVGYERDQYALESAIIDAIERRASEFGVKIADEGVVRINLTLDDLLATLDSGRYKSQHETGKSHGYFDPPYRRQFELDALGVPLDIDNTLRPVYGTVIVDESSFEAGVNRGETSGYGNIQIILKPSVRERTTIIIGDSLVSDPAMAAPIDAGKYLTSDAYSPAPMKRDAYFAFYDLLRLGEFLDDGAIEIDGDTVNIEDLFLFLSDWALNWRSERPPADYPWRDDYIEAQVHGGVSVLDIDEIIVPNSISEENLRSLISRLERLQIKVRNVSGEYLT